VTNKKIFTIISILLLFIILPSSYALNDENITVDDASLIQNEDVGEELLSAGNDFFFNASVEHDGDGSELSPYKYLSTNRVLDGSVIHLANGEYELDDGKSFSSISIIGESCQNSIIKFKNNNSVLTSRGNLVLKNVTLMGMPIINYGTLNANNTIFKNTFAYSSYSEGTNLVNSASNSFGGAIYSPYYAYSTAYVCLDNCTFINNTGEYGGAIYMYGGYLEIRNSIFLDNYAYNYGGAISCEYNSQVTIDKSKFINSKSLNDAGGAIYLKSSKLTANYINISNSNATFGGAITSLSSTLYLNFFDGINNNAKYEGGAIYQIYGTVTIRNSNLINNSAKNGGALFIDNTTSTILYQNKFINNTAIGYGGAIYSLLNVKSKIHDNFNEYYNNKARVEDDLYETSKVSLVIGNGNYSMYKYNDTLISEIPSYYSSLDEGYSTSVKDQQSGGNCWAFQALAVLESCILKASGDNLDLSEENMKNLIELYSDYGWKMDTNEGGYGEMSLAYLLSWLGPVLEENDLYDDYSTISPVLDSNMHVQNVLYLKRNSYTDNDAIKEAILKYGAVGTSFFYDSAYFNSLTNSYYSSLTSYSNHAVAIVGWDDNYSSTNFNSRPRGNGAWIVKNSWNTDWGDEGYFYVSYYDTSFIAIGSDEAAFTFILNDTIKYDKNYQYDIIGKTDYFITGNKNVWYQNVFNATDNEFLAAVSTYFEKTCQWDLSIYVNDILKLTKTGKSDNGYYTIDLGDYIKLDTGDIFKVVFKITANGASFPVSEKIKSNKILYTDGISFFSTDGKKWTDLCDYSTSYSGHTYYSQVACIKAFTFSDEINSTVTLNITDKGYNPVEIVANVLNQYGNPVTGGNVTFTIYGEKYIVPVSNGVAKLNLNLKELITTEVDALFNAVGYCNSYSNASVELTKLYADINLEVVKNMTKAIVNVNVSRNINETIFIKVNDNDTLIKLVNGYVSLVLDNLEMGNYTVKVSLVNDTYVTNIAESNFTINVIPSKIMSGDLISYYGGGNTYSICLSDINRHAISNRDVKFIINGRTFKKVTNNEGIASLRISLPIGSYTIDVFFEGDNNYLNSSSRNNIYVKTTILPSEIKNYLFNTFYSVKLLDNEGNPLSNSEAILTVDGVSHNIKTDLNGLILFNLNYHPGNYNIVVKNPSSDEKYTQTINIIPRIDNNNDLIMYFGNGASYRVHVLDDNGNSAKEGEVVIIKINGVEFRAITDSNGYASFKVTLNPNTYTITAEYKGFIVSNKIIVKPVLTAKNISKKKAKKIKFSAKLVNGVGKPVKGKKITFKFKGKTYKAKTNSKGIAKITLKNLKVGNYKIITKYGKSTIKNMIIIKK
jgi:predicted outer membrane repeat protein